MELKEIANTLVEGCKTGQEKANLDKLYAPDAVSVEAADMGSGREVQGLDAIKGKHDWWDNTFEVLDANITGPMLHGDDKFGVIFKIKAKDRASGQVSDMEEIAVYHVGNGKITREEFFYTPSE